MLVWIQRFKPGDANSGPIKTIGNCSKARTVPGSDNLMRREEYANDRTPNPIKTPLGRFRAARIRAQDFENSRTRKDHHGPSTSCPPGLASRLSIEECHLS
jgi:hypothetical protein